MAQAINILLHVPAAGPTSLAFAFALIPNNFGIAIAAKMPMITITTISSIRVKPLLLKATIKAFDKASSSLIGDFIKATRVFND